MSILVFSPNGTYIAKTSLALASTAEDTVGKHISVTSPITLTSAVTITNRTLDVRGKGKITIGAGGSLSFGVSGRAGDNHVIPLWWFEVTGDGSTDDSAGFQAALNCVAASVIPPRITGMGKVLLKSPVSVTARGLILEWLGGNDTSGGIVLGFNGVGLTVNGFNNTLRNIVFQRDYANSVTGTNLKMTGGKASLENVYVYGAQKGINFEDVNSLNVDNVTVSLSVDSTVGILFSAVTTNNVEMYLRKVTIADYGENKLANGVVAQNVDTLHMTDCVIIGVDNALQLYAIAPISYSPNLISLLNCSFENNKKAIYANGATFLSVSGEYRNIASTQPVFDIVSSNSTVISNSTIGGSTVSGILLTSCNNTQISNSTFSDNSTGASTHYDIEENGSSNTLVTGSSFNGVGAGYYPSAYIYFDADGLGSAAVGNRYNNILPQSHWIKTLSGNAAYTADFGVTSTISSVSLDSLVIPSTDVASATTDTGAGGTQTARFSVKPFDYGSGYVKGLSVVNDTPWQNISQWGGLWMGQINAAKTGYIWMQKLFPLNATLISAKALPDDALFENSMVGFQIDDIANTLTIKVRKADGTFKTATITLS